MQGRTATAAAAIGIRERMIGKIKGKKNVLPGRVLYVFGDDLFCGRTFGFCTKLT
jgi:hypothetical protein